MHSTKDLTDSTNQNGATLCVRAAIRMLGKQAIYDLLPEPLHICISDHRSGCQVDIYFYVKGRPILTAWRGSVCCNAASYLNSTQQVLGLDPHCMFARPILQAFFERVYSAVAIAFTCRSVRPAEKLQEQSGDLASLQYYKSLLR